MFEINVPKKCCRMTYRYSIVIIILYLFQIKRIHWTQCQDG